MKRLAVLAALALGSLLAKGGTFFVIVPAAAPQHGQVLRLRPATEDEILRARCSSCPDNATFQSLWTAPDFLTDEWFHH